MLFRTGTAEPYGRCRSALGMLVFISAVTAFIAVGRGGMAALSGSAILQAALDPLVSARFLHARGGDDAWRLRLSPLAAG